MHRNNTSLPDERLLDEKFGDVVAHLNANTPTVPVPSAEFKTELRTKLYAQAMQQRSDKADAQKKVSQQAVTRLRIVSISVSLALSLLMFTAILWFSGQHPVSAAEIVSRASLAATDTTSFGVKTYGGIRINWLRNKYDPTDSVSNLQPLSLQWQERIWVKVPNQSRHEFYAYKDGIDYLPSSAPIIHDSLGDMIASGSIITDGVTEWRDNDVNNPVKLVELHTPSIGRVERIPSDFAALLKKLGETSNNVSLLGTDVLAGRESYLLSYRPNPDATIWPYTVQVKVWIDKQTYIQLGEENLDAKGIVLSKWLYTKFEVNPDLSPDLFTYKITSDMKVIDLRTPHDEADLALAWRTIALSAEYKVFRPTKIPSQFVMERPYYSVPGGSYSGVSQTQQNFYLADSGLPALFLFEDKNDQSDRSDTPIQIGRYKCYYREEFGRRIIIFEREGTWIFLQANQHTMTKEALIHIAETMELVPKS